MNVNITTWKQAIEYVRRLDKLDCERDISALEEIVASNDLLEEPKVDAEDEAISVSEGQLDEGRLDDVIEALQDGCNGYYPRTMSDGIVLYVDLFGETFVKDGYCSFWYCENNKWAKGLKSGYTDDELCDLFNEFDADEEGRVFSKVLDEAVSVEELFQVDYRLLRSEDDDVDCISRQLDDLGYIGFWQRGNWFYGVKDEDDLPVHIESVSDLLDSDTVASRICYRNGWIGDSPSLMNWSIEQKFSKVAHLFAHYCGRGTPLQFFRWAWYSLPYKLEERGVKMDALNIKLLVPALVKVLYKVRKYLSAHDQEPQRMMAQIVGIEDFELGMLYARRFGADRRVTKERAVQELCVELEVAIVDSFKDPELRGEFKTALYYSLNDIPEHTRSRLVADYAIESNEYDGSEEDFVFERVVGHTDIECDAEVERLLDFIVHDLQADRWLTADLRSLRQL